MSHEIASLNQSPLNLGAQIKIELLLGAHIRGTFVYRDATEGSPQIFHFFENTVLCYSGIEFLTARGWIDVADLRVGDRLLEKLDEQVMINEWEEE